MNSCIVCIKFLLVCSFFILPQNVTAKSYALIVGIDEYKEASDLSGAVADATSISKVLKYQGIDEITVLKNHMATRDNILYELRNISRHIQKDDYFYMFFSGHGTSLQDASFAQTFQGDKKLLAMMENSGALIPSDFTMKHIRESLIIGQRDLRPIFSTIDQKGAVSLVVFDACFSGMTSRSMPSRKSRRRHLVLANKIDFGSASKKDKKRKLIALKKIHFTPKPTHPYSNLIYVASTSTSDWAVEDKSTKRGYLTQEMERCLTGAVDYNRDHKIFKNELDNCLKNSNLPQAPQVYPQDKQVDPLLIRYFEESSHSDVLRVENTSGIYTISDNYSQLQVFDNLSDVERFKRAYRIFTLEGSDSFDLVAYNLKTPDTVQKTYRKGESIKIEMISNKGGYLALFSIDSKGNFYLLEPYDKSIKVKPLKRYTYTENEVGEPLGVDLMKAILFYEKSDLEYLKRFKTDTYGRVRDVGEVKRLYEYLEKLPKSSFEVASLKLFTQD